MSEEQYCANWHERIELARNSLGFHKADCFLAQHWVTCACGEQDSRIPRDGEKAPLDAQLRSLGSDFSAAVFRARSPFGNAEDYWPIGANHKQGTRLEKVEHVLAQIERRASEILNET